MSDDKTGGDVIVKLAVAITAHGEECTSLTLTPPTTEDVCEIGYPYLVVTGDDDSEAIELRPKIVVKYVSRLGKIPLGSAKKISLEDLQTMQAVVMGFFGRKAEQTPPTSKTELSK